MNKELDLGVAALIFPSARCDPETVIDGGELRGWVGFNLVDFRNFEVPAETSIKGLRFDDPDPWDIPPKWPMHCEIAELSENRVLAEPWKGSWRLLGVREGHEKFWQAGGCLAGHDIGEWEKQQTSNPGADFARELFRELRAKAQES